MCFAILTIFPITGCLFVDERVMSEAGSSAVFAIIVGWRLFPYTGDSRHTDPRFRPSPSERLEFERGCPGRNTAL